MRRHWICLVLSIDSDDKELADNEHLPPLLNVKGAADEVSKMKKSKFYSKGGGREPPLGPVVGESLRWGSSIFSRVLPPLDSRTG